MNNAATETSEEIMNSAKCTAFRAITVSSPARIAAIEYIQKKTDCQLEILHQLQAISRTCILTQRAEHAARRVEDEFVEHLFAPRFAGDDDFDIHRNYVDTVFRTCERAEVACDAECVVRLRIHIQP